MRLEKPCLALIFFILVNIGQISAQTRETEKPFKIGAGLGYSFTGYREETDLPLNRYVNALNFKINVNYEKNNLFYFFNFNFFNGETESLEIDYDDDLFTYHQRESDFYRLYLEHALDYRLWGNSILPGYLGGAIRGDVYLSALEQSNYLSLTLICSLNIHITQKWIINAKNELLLSLSIPFFGYALRPPYYGLFYSPLDMEQDITSFHNYQAVFGDFKYNYQLSKLLSFYFGFGFEISHIDFPQPRNDAEFSVNAGIAFSF